MLLTLLFIKHYICDFILQTKEMIDGKGTYGNKSGMVHSLHHAIGTFVVLSFFVGGAPAVFFALLDGVIHYHLDYLKMKYGEKDISKKEFWRDFGLDQLAHSITYILIARML